MNSGQGRPPGGPPPRKDRGAPGDPPPELTCPNTHGQPLHILKNPVATPCCPLAIWCRVCAGKTILRNGKQCYQCGRTTGLSDLVGSVKVRDLLREYQQKRLEEAEQEAQGRMGSITLEPTDADSDSEASSAESNHTLGNASGTVNPLRFQSQTHQEDTREPMILTPTNFRDPTMFPEKRFVPIYGELGIHAIAEYTRFDMPIPNDRLYSKWTITQGPWTPWDDNRPRQPREKVWRWLNDATPPKPSKRTKFRTKDEDYYDRTGDTEKDYRGNELPQIWYVDEDARGAYIMVDDLVPGLSPVLMGKRDTTGAIWWQTTDRVTHKTHQVWLGTYTRPGSQAFQMLVDFAVQNWPRRDLVGPTGGPGRVRIMVARRLDNPGIPYDPSLLTTTDTSGGEDVERGLTDKQIRRHRRLKKGRRRAMEARRRDRDGMPLPEWLAGRFPDPQPLQTAPLVTNRQPLHKSRVWLQDIKREKIRHRSFLPWYPNLKDWLLMGRTPDPTAVNNAYEECDFEDWRWLHHKDDIGDTWLAGYVHRAGPRKGKIRKTYRTLKVLTILQLDKHDTRPEDELRRHRIKTLQTVARLLGTPILACSTAYRKSDIDTIIEGMGGDDWSDIKRNCLRDCLVWREETKWDQDMEPIRPFRSWPEVISFINGFLGGYYETEIMMLEKHPHDFRPEEDEPQKWWPHMFPQDCRRALMCMTAMATQTIRELSKGLRRRTSKEPDAVEINDREKAWWWIRRHRYVRPMPARMHHVHGIWKTWARTPHAGGWDGWTDPMDKRRQRIQE